MKRTFFVTDEGRKAIEEGRSYQDMVTELFATYDEDSPHPVAVELMDKDTYWRTRALEEANLANAAIAYIRESPCDPDIRPEQAQAWEHLKGLCEQMGRLLS